MEVCLKLDNIKLENRPYAEISPYIKRIRENGIADVGAILSDCIQKSRFMNGTIL